MNQINPKKLLHSKWTALAPDRKEKHFMVSRVDYDDDGAVVLCELEAVLTRRCRSIDWRELRDAGRWRHGWQ